MNLKIKNQKPKNRILIHKKMNLKISMLFDYFFFFIYFFNNIIVNIKNSILLTFSLSMYIYIYM